MFKAKESWENRAVQNYPRTGLINTVTRPDKDLTMAGMLTQLLKERSHGVEFRAKAAPIPSFQPRNGAVIVVEGLPCSKVRGARGVSSGWRALKGQGRRGFFEEDRQRASERTTRSP